LPLPSLLGAHQIANAGIALACLEQLSELAVPAEAIAGGLRRIEWPARLQRLTRGPLIAALPEGSELWLDGGHNPAAGEVLAEAAKGWRDRRLDLVVGMLNTKDAAGFLAPLAPCARCLYAVTIPDEENPLPAEAICAAAAAVGIAAQPAASVEAAITSIAETGAPVRVLICGSLHLAGVVLSGNG
jgi:dihydrofolate synthase/folylpolyglutamate synthase